MDLLAQYGDDGSASPSGSEGSFDAAVGPSGLLAAVVSAAPNVDTSGLALLDQKAVAMAGSQRLVDARARSVNYNLPLEEMHAPVLGPAHPYQRDGIAAGLKNHRSGHVEDAYLHPVVFEDQYHSYHGGGTAAAPGGIGTVQFQGDSAPPAKKRKTTAEKRADAERKAALAAAPLDPEAPFVLHQRQPWAEKERQISTLTDEQKEALAEAEAARQEGAADKVDTRGPTTFFHGKAEKDYQGRSWMEAPKDRKKESDYCYLPKKWVHSWSGHSKGVNAIRFFPKVGHLLLSAGMDGKVKIWDVFNTQKCMRTYLGHSKGVREVQFSNDGTRFLSCGYDKNIRLWDTETGTVLRTLNTGKIFYCARFHPEQQNVVMAGCGDKKIYQFDADTGDVMQEYNYHLGAVNSVTFMDGGRRFVSTSDDKTVRVWEFGIPVQIKYIADPAMHSIPAVTPRPDGKYLIGQSLDNQIVTYSTGDRFKQNVKKTFRGHNTAGYACQPNFSPDLRFVMSGDAQGRCFFWEWQHPAKIVRTIQAHEGVCIGCEWHPLESSKVATCGWDGLVKYWD